MSEINTEKKRGKRGRKPKNLTLLNKKELTVIDENQNTEEENIIFHLPITLNEINCDNIDMSLFIKSEKDIDKDNENQTKEKSETEQLDLSSSTLLNKVTITNNINKILTHNLTFTKNTKCWWCKNSFSNPALQLPDDYYNETFYCSGNYCSFNCMKSYNLDINDNLTWKRESLINLLYYLTYSEFKEILPAPHWLTLEEYGGTLSIERFRKNSVENTKEYLLLHPPIISRQMQIEESYKLNKLKEVPIDKVNKIYSEIDTEFAIKRRTPMRHNQLNLETTMGLVKSKRLIK